MIIVIRKLEFKYTIGSCASEIFYRKATIN